MTPEEEDEEAAYDRADDLVRPGLEASGNVEDHARTAKGHTVGVKARNSGQSIVELYQNIQSY